MDDIGSAICISNRTATRIGQCKSGGSSGDAALALPSATVVIAEKKRV